jgi:ArsR family transcriptional regulator
VIDDSFVFKIKSDFLRALGHPSRLRIIEHLKQGEKSVTQIGQKLDMEQSGLSKHLAILKQAGIVHARQEKVTVYYSIRDQDIYDVLIRISSILKKRMRESEQIFSQLEKEEANGLKLIKNLKEPK